PFFANPRPAIPQRFAIEATPRLAPRAEAANALDGLRSATALQFSARAASDLDFRRVLLDHVDLIRPIICLFYPHFFTMRLVATAHTDDCGRFHTLFFNGCHNPDTPDLYFKVKQRFLFFDLTIYAPTPVPCYTWWNY